MLLNASQSYFFSFLVVEFKKLYSISKVLEEGSVFARCIDLVSDNNETERILDELLNNQRFRQARQYAQLVGISPDKISIRQVKYTI